MSRTLQLNDDLTGIFEQLLDLCERTGRRESLFVHTDRDLECYLVVLCDCDGQFQETSFTASRRFSPQMPRAFAH